MTDADLLWLDPDTVRIRQPKASHWEAPFLFLLFGRDRALLLDTGATTDEAVFPLRRTVDDLVDEWLRGRSEERVEPYPLVVAHTHAHRDHVAGDPLLSTRPATTVVGTVPADIVEYFGFGAWPDETVVFDLGERPLDVIGAPGHEASAIVLFDRRSGILFTGDTICPGNLYVRDRAEFERTIDRLILFRDAAPTPVRTLMGAHIEMSREPGVDYPPGTVDQPDEAPLELPPTILDEVRTALDEPGHRVVRDRFILVDEA